jgi:hypothetical protein
VDGRLRLAIYYADYLIDTLERHDPRRGLSEKNVKPFAIFVEEITHAVHGAVKFLEGDLSKLDEGFIRDLELSSKIDTYLVLKFFLAHFNPSKSLEGLDRLWLRYHCFESWDLDYSSPVLRERYRETNEMGHKYVRFLDMLPAGERLQEIRHFRTLNYPTKLRYIGMLP